jgi:hypothetical protein
MPSDAQFFTAPLLAYLGGFQQPEQGRHLTPVCEEYAAPHDPPGAARSTGHGAPAGALEPSLSPASSPWHPHHQRGTEPSAPPRRVSGHLSDPYRK